MSRHSRGQCCSQNEVKTASASALNWPMWCPTRVSKSLFFFSKHFFSHCLSQCEKKRWKKFSRFFFATIHPPFPTVPPWTLTCGDKPTSLDIWTSAPLHALFCFRPQTPVSLIHAPRAICSPQASANRRSCANEFAKVALTLGLEAFAEEATDKLEMKSEAWRASPSLATPAVMVAAGLQESPRYASHKFL